MDELKGQAMRSKNIEHFLYAMENKGKYKA